MPQSRAAIVAPALPPVVIRQPIIIRPKIARPPLAERIEHESPKIEMPMMRFVTPALHSDVCRVRIRPTPAHRRQLDMSKRLTRRNPRQSPGLQALVLVLNRVVPK